MSYLGDYIEDFATLNFKFTTRTTAGVPFLLAGTPAISVYKANDTTQSTAGITLTADFDSVTGLNNVLIDLSADAFYATAVDYHVVITTGTVNGVSVVGEVVAQFSIENRFMRGTDSAALASVCSEARLAELAAANLPSDIDAILADVTGIAGAAMRGTDSGALASVCTEGRLAELDAANLPTDVAARATPAQVNTEVLDVLTVDTIDEPTQEIPPTTGVATMRDAMRYPYFALTSRVDSDAVANFLEFYNRAATVVQWKKAMSDAASIATEGTGEAGP